MSDTTTRGARIHVQSLFIKERSAPDNDYYFFAYRVRIENVGDETFQLKSRHWVITDGNERVEHVKGPGVVGETPRLEPGQHFEYTSFCPLETPVGTMHGSYQMETDEGEPFDAIIAPFLLSVPSAVN